MVLTDTEIQKRLEEVSLIRIELSPDPVSEGLGSLNQKISELQGYKDRVSALLVEAIKNRADAEILQESVRGEYSRKLDSLIASDADVLAQKNEKSRTAMANTKMPELVLQVVGVEQDFAKAEAYYKCIQQIYGNLESANSNLSRQISVIQMAANIGEIHPEAFTDIFKGKKMKLS